MKYDSLRKDDRDKIIQEFALLNQGWSTKELAVKFGPEYGKDGKMSRQNIDRILKKELK